jgi:apolipoprotein N-acyltransferase
MLQADAFHRGEGRHPDRGASGRFSIRATPIRWRDCPVARVRPDQMYRYDKHHLVPFGEFIPLGFRWFVRMMNMPLGDFSAVVHWQRTHRLRVKGQYVAPTICYEDLFGEEIASAFRVDLTQAPPFWPMSAISPGLATRLPSTSICRLRGCARLNFSCPHASDQYRRHGRDRSQGEVTAASCPQHPRQHCTLEVQGMSGVTPYAWWAGVGACGRLMVCGVAVGLRHSHLGKAQLCDTGI